MRERIEALSAVVTAYSAVAETDDSFVADGDAKFLSKDIVAEFRGYSNRQSMYFFVDNRPIGALCEKAILKTMEANLYIYSAIYPLLF